MTRYSDIIARLESASGPSRKLDFAVARAAGLSVRNQSSSGSGTTMFVYDPKAAGGRFNGRIDSRFTASLDATIGLVERVQPGSGFSVDFIPINGCSWAFICDEGPRSLSEAEGSTPAIALLLALFRALEAQEAGE